MCPRRHLCARAHAWTRRCNGMQQPSRLHTECVRATAVAWRTFRSFCLRRHSPDRLERCTARGMQIHDFRRGATLPVLQVLYQCCDIVLVSPGNCVFSAPNFLNDFIHRCSHAQAARGKISAPIGKGYRLPAKPDSLQSINLHTAFLPHSTCPHLRSSRPNIVRSTNAGYVQSHSPEARIVHAFALAEIHLPNFTVPFAFISHA